MKVVDGIDIKIKVAGKTGWEEVKEAALTTIHKSSIEGKPISDGWKENIVLCSHSPVREYKITIMLDNIPRWIADQLVRHNVGVNNYMGTMRSDRGNPSREEQSMADKTVFMQSYNIQSFLQMCMTRMCAGCVSKETRELVFRIVKQMHTIEPIIASFAVPPCIYRLGCKEVGFTSCGHLDGFINHNGFSWELTDLVKRNELYQKYVGIR